MNYEYDENLENFSENTTVAEDIISTVLEGCNDDESAKILLEDFINKASLKLSSFTNDGIDELTELTEEQSDYVEGGAVKYSSIRPTLSIGGGKISLGFTKGKKTTAGVMGPGKTCECIQTAWTLGGNCYSASEISAPAGVTVYCKNNYAYIKRKNSSIKGSVKAKINAYFNDVYINWRLL